MDLDKDHIKEKPWTSVLLNRQGAVSGKNVGDPPELPINATKKLTQAISKARCSLEKRKPEDRGKLKEIVDAVRSEFF